MIWFFKWRNINIDSKWLLVWFHHELLKLDQTCDQAVCSVYEQYVFKGLTELYCVLKELKSMHLRLRFRSMLLQLLLATSAQSDTSLKCKNVHDIYQVFWLRNHVLFSESKDEILVLEINLFLSKIWKFHWKIQF